MPDFNPQVAAKLEQVMRDIPEARPGKMFGMPAYMVNGKLAVGLYKDSVVLKVGLKRTQALIGKAGVEVCEMRGRTWKEWVMITNDLSQHRALLEEAVRYVAANS